MKKQVFLGGSCNPTTWRADIAIPLLTAAGVEFYNPQQEGWNPQMCITEAHEKHEAEELLFVIDAQTRAVGSMVEVAEFVATGRSVSLVVIDMPDGTVVKDKRGDQAVTGRELSDLNRGREYLREMVSRHPNACIFPTVEEAIQHIITKLS